MRRGWPLLGLNVDSALQLLFALPAARTPVRGIEGQHRAGLAADAGVALIVERKRRNLVPAQILPDIFIGPSGQRTHLFERLSRAQLERLHLLQIRARGRLFAPQSREPGVVIREPGKERLHFAQAAALAGFGLIEDAEERFLVFDAL